MNTARNLSSREPSDAELQSATHATDDAISKAIAELTAMLRQAAEQREWPHFDSFMRSRAEQLAAVMHRIDELVRERRAAGESGRSDLVMQFPAKLVEAGLSREAADMFEHAGRMNELAGAAAERLRDIPPEHRTEQAILAVIAGDRAASSYRAMRLLFAAVADGLIAVDAPGIASAVRHIVDQAREAYAQRALAFELCQEAAARAGAA